MCIRDRYIDNYIETLENLGKEDIHLVCYNFMPVFDWTRTELALSLIHIYLVTVKKRNDYVYRYEGNLNGIENAVVLLSYPEKAFGNPKALRAFISTNAALSTQELSLIHISSRQRYIYSHRLPVLFHQ